VSEPDTEQTPVGWQVLDPDGNVVANGPQTILKASGDAGEEPVNGSDR